MSESAHVSGFDWAMQQVRRGNLVDRHAISELVTCDRPDVDSSLLEILRESRADLNVATVASRILIDRDPDRDPSFLTQHSDAVLGQYTVKTGVGKLRSMWTRAMRTGLAPQPFRLGIGRLRQAEPVRLYSQQLKHPFYLVRLVAVSVLGDTKDLAALDSLALALGDRKWRVRAGAADSVRRLRHAGAADLLPTHAVRDGLIECLADRRKRVRVAAARALGSMGDLQVIQKRRDEYRWWAWRRRRELAPVLRGEIPPLPKIWPGDDTT